MSNLYRRTGLDRQGLLLAILAVVAGAIAVIGLTAVTPMAVDAHSSGHSCTWSNHCTPSVGLVYSYGDRWDNYDSNSQSLHNNNVDWAVDLVFYDNAEVDKVKNLINQYNGVGHSGGTKHIIVREANEYQNGSSISYVQMWDDDSGKKNVAPNCSTYCPYRSAAAQTMPAQIGTSAERSGRRSPLDIAITVGGRPSNWS